MSAVVNQDPKQPPAEVKRFTPVMDNGEYSLLLDTARFEQAYRIAKVFSSSQLVPDIFQGNEANCMVAMNMAMRLQIDPMMLMQNMYIVHNKPGMEAKLAIALINSRGPFKGPIQWRFEGEGMKRKCFAFAVHRQTGETCEAECSMDMADKEGWIGKTGSKWKSIPDMMLRYRSATFLGRLYAPECLMGIATADELDDIGLVGAGSTAGASQGTRTDTLKARLGASLAEQDDALRSIEGATVDKATGEIYTDPDMPTVGDALALARAGDYDGAVALASEMDASAQTQVQNEIAEHRKAAGRAPRARR